MQRCSVTVVIPAFNRAKVLGRAIDSCLAQGDVVREILVIDDASTDDTQALVAAYSGKDNRVRYVRLAVNRGAQFARIAGIKESRSPWIAFLDSDDELLLNSLAIRCKVLEEGRPVAPGLIYGDIYSGYPCNRVLVRFEHYDGFAFPQLCRELSLCPYSAMMVQRSCFEIVPFPNADFPAWQDDDMVLTIARRFPIVHCGMPVAALHGAQGNNITDNKAAIARGCAMMVQKYRRDVVRNQGEFRALLWRVRVGRSYLVALHQKLCFWCLQTESREKSFSLAGLFAMRIGAWIVSILVRVLNRLLRSQFSHIWG